MSIEYFIAKERHAFSLDRSIPPVMTVQAPCTITFETDDLAYRRLSQGDSPEEIDSQNFNMVTGPVYIDGAEPGDALRLEVLDVTVRSAWTVWFPGGGALGKKTEKLQVRELPLEGSWAVINENLKVPLAPMIGCIGVAPPHGRSSTLEPAYPWGGNMDLQELSAGAVIYLPVQVPGALLSLGDLHAAMGTGEATDVGLEAAGEAKLKISLEKGLSLPFPRLRCGDETICIGIADAMEGAVQLAYDQAYDLLVGEFGLDPFDAYAYASARIDLRFGGPASAIALAVVPDMALPGGTPNSLSL